MGYQTVDTQPERTALAWSRTSLALFVGTVWVCRAAFLTHSIFAITVLALSTAIVLTNYLLLRRRKRVLRRGVDAATASGIENLMITAQVLLIGVAALVGS